MGRETAVEGKPVQEAERALMQEPEDMTTAESAGTTTRMPETMFQEMLNASRGSLSDLASSDDGQNGEDEDNDEEDTEFGKLSHDDEPEWVMGTISKTVQHRIESCWQKQMTLDKVTQPGWGDAANYFRDRDMKYGTAELMVPVVVKPRIDTTSATSPLTTFGEYMQTLDMVRRQWQMPAVTSRPGSSQLRLGSERPQ